jgi:ubiquitin C-terminal hydrolase
MLLDIRRASTLDDALAAYFCKERLDNDDAYHCEQCHRKVSATKKFSLEKPPLVLCLQFKRYVILISEILHFIEILCVVSTVLSSQLDPSTAIARFLKNTCSDIHHRHLRIISK